MDNILRAFTVWVSENWAASAIAGGITWDIIKEYLVLPLSEKVQGYFGGKKQTEKFIEDLSKKSVINEKDPSKNIMDVYKNIMDQDCPEELIDKLKEFFINNSKLIEEINKKVDSHGSININSQIAGRDINNISGGQITINK